MDKKAKKRKKYILKIFIVVIGVILIYKVFFNSNKTSNVLYYNEDYSINNEEAINAINIMDKECLYTNSPDWKKQKEKALKSLKETNDKKDIMNILGESISIAGGKHSSFAVGNVADENTVEKYSEILWQLPETNVEEDILYLKLPPTLIFDMSRFEEYIQEYGDTLSMAIYENQSVSGIIIDLSYNSGGSMLPMIGGLAALLPDGNLFSFIDKDNREAQKNIIDNGNFIIRENNLNKENIYKAKNSEYKIHKPVAIIIDKQTASAAEATLIAFMGLPYAKSFGNKTAGYATGNSSMEISENVEMIITSVKNKARTGEVFSDERIKPDALVLSGDPYSAARKWIKEYNVDSKK